MVDNAVINVWLVFEAGALVDVGVVLMDEAF
jgi:hypothetical protein